MIVDLATKIANAGRAPGLLVQQVFILCLKLIRMKSEYNRSPASKQQATSNKPTISRE